MAYTVNKTNGSVLTTIADGTIDTTTDLTLIGKNYAGYGEILNENYIKVLENFANTTAPSSPIAGQLWWDTAGNLMKTYTGTVWKTISSSTAAATAPSSNVTGDLWWDTVNGQLKVYNGTAWVLIGPAYTAGAGQSGLAVETITDSVAASHVIVRMYVSDTTVAIISKDAVFTPQSPISGFATIKPGYNLSTTLANAKFQGESSNTSTLDGIDSTQFLRADADDTTTGRLSILNDSGLILGADSDLTVDVTAANVDITNNSLDGDINFVMNDGGAPTTALTIDGATSRLLVAGDPTVALGVATKQYADLKLALTGGTLTGALTLSGTPTANLHAATKQYVDAQVGSTGALLADGSVPIAGVLYPDANGTRDLGTTANRFAIIYGTATSAQYADLAERFAADEVYAPGTVVKLGGDAEVTQTTSASDTNVFGVVSTNPAHLMNEDAGTDETHPAIALAGRVPVLVTGPVTKGQRLASSMIPGVAQAISDEEASNTLVVIGRALADSDDAGLKLVETVVGSK